MTALKRRASLTSLSIVAACATACAAPPPVPMEHLVLGALEGPGATLAFVTPERPALSDEQVAAAARAELAQTLGPHADGLDVDFHEGRLTLSGTLRSLAVHDAALQTVAKLRNVTAVDDDVKLDIPTVEDATIREGVERQLRNAAAIDPLELDVAVDQGIVTLDGRVHSAPEERLAVELARRVRGVRKVDDQIVYEPEPRSDSEIADDVRSVLSNDLFLGNDDVSVNVDDGRVTLSGKVRTLAERRRAEELAWVDGVENVHAGGIEVSFEGTPRYQRRAPHDLDDTRAAAAVERSLAFVPTIPLRAIHVRVRDGRVVLTGVVSRYEAKEAAEDAARQTRIGTIVDNRIEVHPESEFTDAYLASAIRDALVDEPTVNADDVSVEVIGGEATLRGTVDSVVEREAAHHAAAAVSGVTEVDDELATKHYFEPNLTTPDARIARAVENALLRDPWVSGAHMIVSVQDGHVYLSGVVGDELSRRRAVEDSHDAGADAVTSQLVVAEGGTETGS